MSTERHPTSRISPEGRDEVIDDLAVEEALEVQVDGAPFAVLMRLPGADLDLVTGFCLTEGVASRVEEIESVRRCPDEGGENRVLVTLARRAKRPRAASPRVLFSRSSCGLCGRQLLEETLAELPAVPHRLRIQASSLLSCKETLEASQPVFAQTGATHGAALFGEGCRCLAVAEDLGRHNALDKAIGAVARAGLLDEVRLALLSSRLSFEMVQKAAAVGIELLAGLSAATTLAARLADRQGMTLVGFLRPGRMNVYTHPERVLGDVGVEPPAELAEPCPSPACPSRSGSNPGE